MSTTAAVEAAALSGVSVAPLSRSHRSTAHTTSAELLPEVSRATVYNTLNELVAMGEVNDVMVRAAPSATTPTSPSTTSTWCAFGELRDVQPLGEADLRLPRRQGHGYRLLDVDIVFRGLCRRCQGEGRI